MQIESPVTTRPITYYEVISNTGLRQSITIDTKAGDTYSELDHSIEVVLAPKPSLVDKTKTLPAQYIKIFKRDVFSIQHWTVEVQDLTPEQQQALIDSVT